ncbi:MAG: MFS transporter [Verrucomicrobia bacterium]|nr:MFS transporter [Verrucomicrobiota bacterium]
MIANSVDTLNPPAAKPDFPPGLNNVFAFQAFNGLSFQMVLSSPMVLYAKTLGASATVLGIITGMTALLVIFQIPATQYVPRVGYKRFVLAGWGMRVTFIFGMVLVPLTGSFLNPTTRLSLMLLLLFVFNLSRGISSCAWLPWITSLLPASIRGSYLAREAACINVASFGAFLLAALALGQNSQPWQFAVLFLFSAVMGVMSLVFLKRVPEGDTPEQVRTSTTPVPWREIIGYAPFQKLLRMNVAWSIALGGLTTFIVAFLKTEVALPERSVMLVTSISFLGGLSSLWFLGSRIDLLGSKPVITFSLLTWLLILTGWALIAAHVFPASWPLLMGLQFLMGLAMALVNQSNTRLAMGTIPVMGRSHFFALYSVIASLTLGLAPIFWGMFIDALQPLHSDWHGFEWNRFSLFFAAVGVMFLVTLALCRRLDEPQARTMEDLLRDVLEQSPLRFWLRLWPRG